MGKTLGYGEFTVANVTEPLLLFVVVRSGLITQLEILLLAVGLLSVRAVKELHLV